MAGTGTLPDDLSGRDRRADLRVADRRGRDAEAIEVIRKDNPFPWVCGLVCTRPCEFMCVRGRIDKPVSIKFLKAFAAERALSGGSIKIRPKRPTRASLFVSVPAPAA
jgi:NADPH-dependent glutamate synthase beta subunit-like oxidoreductase